MIRTHIFACHLPQAEADALNRESGRVYTQTVVWHYRTYRHTGHWLSQYGAMRLGDAMSNTTLHAHSRDAAQEAFYKACKTAKANRSAGAHYPHRLKKFRTTIWKNTGIRLRESNLLLARSRGLAPISVALPAHLVELPAAAFLEMRLVYERATGAYAWHAVIEDGTVPAAAPGSNVAAVDLGEIHPAAATDGTEAVVFTARQLRSVRQYTNKRLAELRSKQAHLAKRSRRWRKLQRRKSRFLAQQQRRARDIEHKVSRAVVDWAVERAVGTLALGDVRDVADGKRLNTKSQQKIGNWSHGKLRSYIEYKAQAAGIATELVDEHHTSQTCPQCGQRHKPQGRVYRCPSCGFVGHRDAVGAANILSRCTTGEVGKVLPPQVKYRYPFDATGKRSPVDTGQVASMAARSCAATEEAAAL
jgi:putative transposase